VVQPSKLNRRLDNLSWTTFGEDVQNLEEKLEAQLFVVALVDDHFVYIAIFFSIGMVSKVYIVA